MKNKEYWQKRFDLLQAQQLNKGIEFYHNLSEQYDKAAVSVQKEIEAFYQRFAKNNELDLFEAKKLLNSRQLKEFRWDVAEYIEKGKTLNYSDKWAKELENASIRYRVTRLEALKLQMQQQVENLIGNEVDGLDNLTRQIYEDGYYQTIFELQKGTGVTSSFAILDADKIKKVLSKPWASDGLDFSRRVWGQHRAELVQKLNTDFVQALIRGDDSQKLINKISSNFNVSKYKAGRLVMTESAFFATESQKDAFKELGVKYFSVSATFDRDTCSDCGYREGEKIPMDLYEVGVTAPPFHPNCRCDIVPEDTDGDIKSYRAARDKNGNYVEVPNDMSYTQWKKKFVDENDKKNIVVPTKVESKKSHKIELKKLQAAMGESDYKEYKNLIQNHKNENIKILYSKYGDAISQIKQIPDGGAYKPYSKIIEFDKVKESFIEKGIHPFNTLTHEYGHAFDNIAEFIGLNYNEVDTLNKHVVIGSGMKKVFNRVPSSSDEFLSALRKDKEIFKHTFHKIKNDLLEHHASAGIQDAITGFFGTKATSLKWGHPDKYFDSIYNKWLKTFNKTKECKIAYKELGFDVSNEHKLKKICKIYVTASETWANIMAAEVCGGEELKYVKKYLPNTYKAFLEIIKKVG